MTDRDDLRAAVEALRDEWASGSAVGYDRNEQVELDTEKAHARTLTALLAEHPASEPPSVAVVLNPEAIGDFAQTPIVQAYTEDDCPEHSQHWLYKAVRNNRRLDGLDPQPCTCPSGGEVTADELAEAVIPRLVNVSNLPEWMQVAALGRPMRPLAALVTEAILARFDVRRKP